MEWFDCLFEALIRIVIYIFFPNQYSTMRRFGGGGLISRAVNRAVNVARAVGPMHVAARIARR